MGATTEERLARLEQRLDQIEALVKQYAPQAEAMLANLKNTPFGKMLGLK